MGTILIVDDSRTMRKVLAGSLKEAGHYIIGNAGNGREALDMLKTLSPDLPDLITPDITMPDMDGLEALKRIRAEYPDQKVVMVSAAGQKDKIMEALKYGAVDFIQKPYDPDTAMETFQRILG
ncbi:MAG: response regulator [Lachnospiraceae bacterium]|nr:response regulator [Lachnospiraceae bacterium]